MPMEVKKGLEKKDSDVHFRCRESGVEDALHRMRDSDFEGALKVVVRVENDRDRGGGKNRVRGISRGTGDGWVVVVVDRG